MKTTTLSASNTNRPSQTHRVAVYGSLRQGMGNHGLLRSARFVGRFWTAPAYTMRSLGYFPGMIDGGDTAILCEVYDVDDNTFDRLDVLESNGRYYERQRLPLVSDDPTAADTLAWVYILMPGHRAGDRVISGDWISYRTGTDAPSPPRHSR